MAEPYLTAAFGIAAALLGAIVTAFLQPFVTSRLSTRPQLRVTIKISNFALPQAVAQSMRSYAIGRWRELRPDRNSASVFTGLTQSSNLLEIKVKNIGRVTCKNITIKMEGTEAVYQAGTPSLFDERKFKSETARDIALGDLQPGQEIDVLAWASFVKIFGNPVTVTADDTHRIRYIRESLTAQKSVLSIGLLAWITTISIIVTFLIQTFVG